MLPMSIRLSLPAFLLVGCVQISAEVEDACLHRSGLQIAGLPLPEGVTEELLEQYLPQDMPAVEQEFVHEDFEALEPILNSGLDAKVFFTGATFRGVGVEDLSFLRSIELVGASSNPDAALGSMDLGSCSDDSCTDGPEAHLTVDEELDMMEYLTTGSVKFRMTVAGNLPREDWALDVDICMRGSVKFEAGL
jgi:hypothetical protein